MDITEAQRTIVKAKMDLATAVDSLQVVARLFPDYAPGTLGKAIIRQDEALDALKQMRV